MRLTLRTLLAYRDGVLDSQDAQVLESKIRSSSTAQQIAQRIEEGMRNRRLAPIPVDAREFGFEANQVAEYLDDTISVEHLPEMERKCLENNALLSEIGSCHQIISRAISVPTHISGALRQRIRELPANPVSLLAKSLDKHGQIRRIDRPITSVDTESPSNSGNSIVSSGNLRKRNTELRTSGIELSDVLGKQVPEYLIGSDRGWIKRAILATALVLALMVVGSLAIGPLDRVRNLLEPRVAIESNQARSEASEKRADSNSKGSNELVSQGGNGKEPATNINKDAVEIHESASAPPVPVPKTDSEKSSTEKPSVAPPDGKKAEVDSVPESDRVLRMQWLPEDKPSADAILLSKKKDLADAEAGWKRLNAGEFVTPGIRIAVLPGQRSVLRLEPGLRWLCAGESDLELLESTSRPKVSLRFGRAIVFATPDCTSLDVDCNGMLITIQFGSVDSSCAIEVLNEIKPSTLEQPDHIDVNTTLHVYGIQGETEVTTPVAESAPSKDRIGVGQYCRWKNGVLGGKHELNGEPWWLRSSHERPVDKLASDALQQLLSKIPADNAQDALSKMISHRTSENAALAIRSNLVLGNYHGLFSQEGAFNRKELHTHWNLIVSQLHHSLARDEYRQRLLETMKQEVPSRFESILSLLIPKSQEQLKAGGDKFLVEALASSSKDERVIAIYQLKRITGETLGYHPDRNTVEAIQLWRKMLGKGEIRYPESQLP